MKHLWATHWLLTTFLKNMLNENVFQCIDVVVYNMVVYGRRGMDGLIRQDGLRSITVMFIGCLYTCRFGMLRMITRYFS